MDLQEALTAVYHKDCNNKLIVERRVEKRLKNLKFEPFYYDWKQIREELANFQGLSLDYTDINTIMEKIKSNSKMKRFTSSQNALYILLTTIFTQDHPNPNIFTGILIKYYNVPMLLLNNQKVFNNEMKMEDNYILSFDIRNLHELVTSDLSTEFWSQHFKEKLSTSDYSWTFYMTLMTSVIYLGILLS